MWSSKYVFPTSKYTWKQLRGIPPILKLATIILPLIIDILLIPIGIVKGIRLKEADLLLIEVKTLQNENADLSRRVLLLEESYKSNTKIFQEKIQSIL